jgi:hypothetical protein
MKDKTTLTITSLLSILFFAFHWVDDIVRGLATGRLSGLGGVLILVIWLYGTLVLGEGRSGHVIMLLGSLSGLGVLVMHMRGAGLVGGRIAHSSGVFFWVWILIALGVTSSFSIIVSARALWGLQRGRSPLGTDDERRVVSTERPTYTQDTFGSTCGGPLE